MSHRAPLFSKYPTLGMLFSLLAVLLAIILSKGLAEPAKLDQARLAPAEEQPLAGALRAGHWEFEQYRDRIVIEQPQAIAASHPTEDLALELTAHVRNKTGRVIKGLEVRGAVVDRHGGAVSERVAVVIPAQQTAIEPDESIKARVLLGGLSREVSPDGVRVEVTGVVFD
jgi:hypothetical protein